MTDMPHEIKVGDVYQTRNGLTARIIATDKQGNDYPIVALVKDKSDDYDIIIVYSRDGHPANMSTIDRGADLILPEPYKDWKIDDPVWVWTDAVKAPKARHFAGLDENGQPLVWRHGTTSHSTNEYDPISWPHISKTKPPHTE
jgi:hypothetical protein